MKPIKQVKFKYIYQQFFSHISIIIVAFLLLSFVFTYYVKNLVFENKADELMTFGNAILSDIGNSPTINNQIINEYSSILEKRGISFSLFDQDATLYAVGHHGPALELTKSEWKQVTEGQTIVVNSDFKRFKQEGVSFVVIPFLNNGQFWGGILLTSPISGTSKMITQLNKSLFYTILIAFAVSFLQSWLLSRIHVKRIKRLRNATSMVAAGDYTVKLPSSTFDEIGELANDFNNMVTKLKTSREEIENLENRRRQFMADVSHEMRTPLTTISGVIEGLKNDMISDKDKETGIKLVSEEAKRLIRLVNENLDYEKIRSNQIQLYMEDIQVLEVFEIIQEQLQWQAKEKNDRIIAEASPDLMIRADYDRLIQILINITKNSIQFTTNGTIWLRGKREGNNNIIEIEDTGIGIEPEEVEKIWRRFYKADLSRTSNPYGEFGLGLSIVKQLVMLHKGDIKVYSKQGKGTKFVIQFQSLKTS